MRFFQYECILVLLFLTSYVFAVGVQLTRKEWDSGIQGKPLFVYVGEATYNEVIDKARLTQLARETMLMLQNALRGQESVPGALSAFTTDGRTVIYASSAKGPGKIPGDERPGSKLLMRLNICHLQNSNINNDHRTFV
ncbi:hypothetical protein BDZ91DRAFT_791138 [Kalaharituber pfeilii]|nr:hypothetical protein BDZ91DRAFT_791138 [Kalaharituber pfeilii]